MGLDHDLEWDPARARTQSERVTHLVREAILSGELGAGASFGQAELARRLGVSVAPLREALRQLEAEGFVRLSAHRGAEVAPLDPAELLDFIDISTMLESFAIRQAVPRMTPVVLEEAERLCREIEREPDRDRWIGLMLRLRLTLYASCGRGRLLGIIRLVRLNSHRYARAIDELRGGAELTRRLARELVDVCRRGDAEAAARMIESSYAAASRALAAELAAAPSPVDWARVFPPSGLPIPPPEPPASRAPARDPRDR